MTTNDWLDFVPGAKKKSWLDFIHKAKKKYFQSNETFEKKYDEVFRRLSSLTQDYEYQSEVVEDLRKEIKQQKTMIKEQDSVAPEKTERVFSREKKTIFDRIDLG